MPHDDALLVLNHLRDVIPPVVANFDARYESDLRQLGEWLAPSYSILGEYARGDHHDEPLSTCVKLLWNAVDTVMAATELLRSGRTLQPPILLRTVVIMLATALHLRLHPEDLPTFETGVLEDKVVLATAKRVVTPFGRLYGLLSDDFVHVGLAHRMLHVREQHDTKSELVAFNLTCIRHVTWLAYVTTEAIFVHSLKAPRYWKPVSETGVDYAPSPEETRRMNAWLALPPEAAPKTSPSTT